MNTKSALAVTARGGTDRDQVDEGHSVVVDAPQCHHTHGIHGNHDDGEQVQQARANVHAQQDAAHHECRQQTHGDIEEALRNNAQVLFIEDICHPVGVGR